MRSHHASAERAIMILKPPLGSFIGSAAHMLRPAQRPSAKKRSERRHYQRNSRNQQQEKHDLAKGGFV
jgi:ATP-dependent protease ClpP protease subunit